MPKVSQGCETNKAHTDAHPTKSEWDSANAKPYKHTDAHPTKSEWDSAKKLIDGADGEQSLSLATDRVERILTLIKSQNVAIYNKK